METITKVAATEMSMVTTTKEAITETEMEITMVVKLITNPNGELFDLHKSSKLHK